MENASKALIMAGGVLISIIIISMLMLMINSLTSYQQTDLDVKRDAQVVAFNQQFEGYNRDGVRGNELYSLINRTMDYNQRKSFIVPGTDEYEPMTVTVDFNGKNSELCAPGETDNHIFTKSVYTFNDEKSNMQNIETMQDIADLLNNMPIQNCSNNPEIKKKTIYLTEEMLQRMVTAYNKLFSANMSRWLVNTKKYEKEIKDLIYNFNTVLGIDDFFIYENFDVKTVVQIQQIQGWLVNDYYEYVQFKRGHFNCTGVKYSDITGRIIEMNFVFTGEFN